MNINWEKDFGIDIKNKNTPKEKEIYTWEETLLSVAINDRNKWKYVKQIKQLRKKWKSNS